MAYTGTKAQKEAVKRYQQSRDNIMIRPTVEEGQKIRTAAEKAGKSVQAYILDVLREKIE